MIKKYKRYLSLILAGAIVFSNMVSTVKVSAETVSEEVTQEVTNESIGYEIYPNPQNITYKDSDFIIRKDVNVVYENGIDEYTKNRLNEVTKLKDLNVTVSDSIVKGKTNILVGVKGSEGYVDNYSKKYELNDTELFNKKDAYLLAVDNEVITVLGKDTDSAFYGLTTLYHVFAQLESYTIKDFIVEDYANVVTRGFIEGYYGNPWSVEDRSDLMTYGGYYKLNAYFYAPKDDPKHRVQWRTLYTEDELKWIKELADAGNASKCRFVYGIHPFPGEDPFALGKNAGQYDRDLSDLKAKLTQVIEQGVRQVAILADDFANPGGELGLRLVNDITNWLENEVKLKYPDMKTTLPYIPFDYMGNGSSNEFSYLKESPQNVQLVMTGGKVWGEVTQNFSQNFKNNTGRAPYYWINWPCSDNSKKHLIMGGNATFLHPGVDSDLIEGIMLNPMQQSEANKSALFAVADYSWNIWDTEKEANQNWNDSFKYMDHNSAIETEASSALREISKHMINQAMDSRVSVLQESVELAPKLNEFKTKYASGKSVKTEALELIEEFTKIKDAANYYRNNPGNEKTRDQIIYWLDCWEDTTTAAISYLKAIIAKEEGNNGEILSYYTNGQAAFEKSQTYGFKYVNSTQYAEVGVQHIVPFIKTLGTSLSKVVEETINPNEPKELEITVTTENIEGNGTTDYTNVIDGNKTTMVHFKKSPYEFPDRDIIPANATITLNLNKSITLGSVYVKQDSGNDRLTDAVIEYSVDGKTNWQELGKLVDGAETSMDLSKQNITVKAVRIRNKTVRSYWWKLYEFQITEATEVGTPIEYTLIKSDSWSQYSASSYPLSNLTDGNIDTFVWFDPDVPQRPSGSKPDTALANDFIGYDLGKTISLDSAYIVVGANNGDKFINYTIETSLDNQIWTPVEGYENYKGVSSGRDVLNINLNGREARYIRIRNLTDRASWVKFSEFTVKEKVDGKSENVYTNVETDMLAIIGEGKAELTPGLVTLNKNQYIGLKLDSIKELANIEIKPELESGLKLQTSQNTLIWSDLNLSTGSYEDARYIRIINTSDETKTINIEKFVVTSNEVFEKGFYDSNIAVNPNYGQNDMRKIGDSWKIFDKNLTTGATLSGYPTKDGYVTFDLGQEITINSIRYYLVETQINFIRDAVFEVSNDPNGDSWTEVLNIGDGKENSETGTNSTGGQLNVKEYAAMDESYGQYIHDTNNPGNMYVSNEGLNATGRYLRVRFTAPYKHRFATFDEILINDGQYYPVENNKNYESNVIEEEGKQASNMNDGDLTTTYKASSENGYITYRLSEPVGIRSIRFIQKGNASNATITGKLYSDGNIEEVKLGTLNQTITEFIVPEGKTLLEAKISWEDNIPEIAEIFISSNEVSKVDKSKLNEEIKKSVEDNWTLNSKEVYNNALSVAKEIANNEYVSQESIDLAYNTLVLARANAKIKADATKLKEILENVISNENNIYSVRTYTVYENAVNNIEKALLDEENLSEETAKKLEEAYEAAKNGLVYSLSKREEAELIIKDAPEYLADNYTEESYNNMVSAKKELENAVNTDKNADNDNRISPEEMALKIDAYNKAVENLVNVSILKASIEEFNTFNEDIYTLESYEAYKLAVENSKKLLVNGTLEEVNKAIEDINTAKSNLKIQALVDLGVVIDDAKNIEAGNYTEASYAVLAEAIKEAEAITDPEMVEEAILKITNAKNELVNIVALKDKILELEKLDSEKYTKSTYEILLASIEEANNVMKNGTSNDVKLIVDKLEDNVNKLELRAANMKEYLDSITLKEEDKYTEESYADYKTAYDELIALPLDDTNTEKFNNAKDKFEKAELLLKEKDKEEVVPPTNGSEDDETNSGNQGNENNNNNNGSSSNDGSVNNPGKDSESDNNNKNENLPETGGSNVMNVVSIGILLLAIGSVIILKGKKDKLKKAN